MKSSQRHCKAKQSKTENLPVISCPEDQWSRRRGALLCLADHNNRPVIAFCMSYCCIRTGQQIKHLNRVSGQGGIHGGFQVSTQFQVMGDILVQQFQADLPGSFPDAVHIFGTTGIAKKRVKTKGSGGFTNLNRLVIGTWMVSGPENSASLNDASLFPLCGNYSPASAGKKTKAGVLRPQQEFTFMLRLPMDSLLFR